MPRCFSPAMALNGVPVLSIIALLLGCFLLFRLLSPNTLPYPDSIILFYGKVMIRCALYLFRQPSPHSVTQCLLSFSLHYRSLKSAVEPYQCHTHVFAFWYYHPLQHPHPLVRTFSPFVPSFKRSSFSACLYNFPVSTFIQTLFRIRMITLFFVPKYNDFSSFLLCSDAKMIAHGLQSLTISPLLPPDQHISVPASLSL